MLILSSRSNQVCRFVLAVEHLDKKTYNRNTTDAYDLSKPPTFVDAPDIPTLKVALAGSEHVARLSNGINRYPQHTFGILPRIVLALESGGHRHTITANGRMGFTATQQFACVCWLNSGIPGSLSVVAMLAVQCHQNTNREQQKLLAPSRTVHTARH